MKWILSVILALVNVGAASAQEAEIRKSRSIEILKVEGIHYIDHLPALSVESATRRRAESEVVERVIALVIVAVKGETGDQDFTLEIIEQFDAEGFFTHAEKKFIENTNPTEKERVQFTWRYECVQVLLWALGIFDELGRPDQIADVPRIAETMRDLGTSGILEAARLRPQSEILDEADLIYRYHWAERNARLNGSEEPEGLVPGVIWERHHALNWLYGYRGQSWDDISTDT